MNHQNNCAPHMYRELLTKLNEVTKRMKRSENDFLPSHSSPTINDLWRSLHPSPSSTFGCPYCPHCTSPLAPHFPQYPHTPLLSSLNSCQPQLEFINAVVWLKSLLKSSPSVPITEVRRILKALVEIEENAPPCLPPQVEVPEAPPGGEGPSIPPALTMILEMSPRSQRFPQVPVDLEKSKKSTLNRAKDRIPLERMDLDVSADLKKSGVAGEHNTSEKFVFLGQTNCQKGSENSLNEVKRRRLEDNDSAVVLEESPGRNWDSFTQNIPQDDKRKALIPDSDEEASQMTPDMSFGGTFEWNGSTIGCGDSQLLPPGFRDDLNVDDFQEVIQLVKEIEANEAISSVELAGILEDFPIISVILTIVRSTLRALEAEDSVEYCWREGTIVLRAVRVILEFIDTVATEEYKYPGYLDFFVKCSVQTVVSIFERCARRTHVDVKRYHHLTTVLELCNCRAICEDIISYLFESLSKLSEEESTGEESPLLVSTQSKKCLIVDALYMTLEKYAKIMNSNLVQSPVNFFHADMAQPGEKLLHSWEMHLQDFVTKSLNDSPSMALFLQNLFRNLKIRLTKPSEV
ncbi:uncharacterized protein LOC135163156 [Diachasmimorpha longicaudata]|uniref:uncharacterized protein LOC135163156 n=1 Tax=Diachasmimorpha longicaudata TaxID=58733 RepID=UPI0030B88CB4